MRTTSTSYTSAIGSQRGAWERWWSEGTGAVGEILWTARRRTIASNVYGRLERASAKATRR